MRANVYATPTSTSLCNPFPPFLNRAHVQHNFKLKLLPQTVFSCCNCCQVPFTQRSGPNSNSFTHPTAQPHLLPSPKSCLFLHIRRLHLHKSKAREQVRPRQLTDSSIYASSSSCSSTLPSPSSSATSALL